MALECCAVIGAEPSRWRSPIGWPQFWIGLGVVLAAWALKSWVRWRKRDRHPPKDRSM
jgi:hypothetical protein